MKFTSTIFVLGALSTSLSTNAETLWSSKSLTYLKNTSNFEVNTNDDIDVFTLEHASGHNWGDVFAFIDRIDAKEDKSNAEQRETYGELSARLSLDYLADIKLNSALISDVFIAATWEHSSLTSPYFNNSFDNYLLGVGTEWKIDGFAFFGVNLYHANNEQIKNDTQLTITYGYPIAWDNHKVMIDGYIDWSSAEDDHAADFHFNPQVRLDVGNYFGKPDAFHVGIEYSYWHNKFGIAGIDNESVVSLLVKLYL